MSSLINANGSSVEKALAILLVFNKDQRELGTTEISTLIGVPKSTGSRLLKILVSAQFLRQNARSKKYSLGNSAYRLAAAATKVLDTRMLVIAQPLLKELAQQTGHSIALETLSGIDVVLALHVEGPSHLRFIFQQGEIVPINVAAGAKAILAQYDTEFLNACMNRTFERFNEKTIVDKDAYLRELLTVKREGVAYDRGERYGDSHAMAVPIPNPNGPPTGAVVMAGPASQLTEAFLATVRQTIVMTAARIAEKLYGNQD
jgi:DNA-binding IclR family transcriptional regulator